MNLNLKELVNLRDALGLELQAAREQIVRLDGFVKRGEAFVKLLDDAVRQTQQPSVLPPSVQPAVDNLPPLPVSQPHQPSQTEPRGVKTSPTEDNQKRRFDEGEEDDLDAYLSSIPHQPAVKLPPRTKSAPAGLVAVAGTRSSGEGEVSTTDVAMKEDEP